VGGGVHRSAGSYNLLCSQLVLVCSPLPCSMVLRGCRLKVLVGRNHCVSACPPQVGSHLTSCSLTFLTLLCALQVWSRCSVGIGPRSSHGDCCLHRTLPFPDFAQLMLSLESTVRWEREGDGFLLCRHPAWGFGLQPILLFRPVPASWRSIGQVGVCGLLAFG